MEAANVASVSITVQIVMIVFTFIVGHLLRRRKIMVVHEAGTLISTFGVGILMYLFGLFKWTYSMPFLVCLSFGALISATDPVTVLSIFHELGTDADLYAYVFGESVLNDAVAIVMYKTVLSFITGPINDKGIFEAISFFVVIFVGSFSIGALAGILSALLFKYGGFQEKELGILESCLVVLFPYLAYNAADALELSGIVSILFAGITMKYYTAPNLSSQAQQITTSFFQMLSKLSETFVFIYIGLGTFLEEQSWNNVGFTFFTIVSILIARMWNVYPCAALVNRFRTPSKQIRRNQQHALWFSGLRGAMAFAIARQSVTDLPSGHGHVLLTATLLTIFFTVLFIGGLTSYALKFLNIVCHGPGHGDDDQDEDISLEESMADAASSQKVTMKKVTPRSTTLSRQKEKISEKLKQLKTDTSFTTLDTKYLKPFLQAAPSGSREGTHSSEATDLLGQMQHGTHQAPKYNKELPKFEEEEVDEEEFSERRGLLASSRF